ncbi:MAG: hypothetical protein A3E25_17895 [Burkholderiales bacterium RIFCSPHIGHO2_12_FULL_69_20]|nr:MAG: hypothetical protein A3E25_17895 [Burkholderiales bacterium RIFCSPHIGHO2_12_FULL_69_20]
MNHPVSTALPSRSALALAAEAAGNAIDVAPEALAAEPDARACGWFESSWALRQGLAVSELPDSDSAVAALWFAELAAVGGRSAASLQ